MLPNYAYDTNCSIWGLHPSACRTLGRSSACARTGHPQRWSGLLPLGWDGCRRSWQLCVWPPRLQDPSVQKAENVLAATFPLPLTPLHNLQDYAHWLCLYNIWVYNVVDSMIPILITLVPLSFYYFTQSGVVPNGAGPCHDLLTRTCFVGVNDTAWQVCSR